MADDENHIFYNVLPTEKSKGPLVNEPDAPAPKNIPTSNVAAASTTTTAPRIIPTTSPLRTGNKRNKTAILIVGGIIILALLAVGAYFLLRSKKDPIVNNNQTPADQQNTIKQPEGVTTSAEWQRRYFGAELCQTLEVCADASDPDRDGLTNVDEEKMKTDPNNPDSNGGGIADGDKVNIFGGDPLKSKSKEGAQYNDADYYKYGYDITTDQPYTAERLQEIKEKIKTAGLHQPTIKTLGDAGLLIYDFSDPNASAEDTLSALKIDQSAGAKLERDTQRSATIKKIGSALLKFKKDSVTYPNTTEFSQMVEKIKLYVTVATNFDDPINRDKYIYGYVPSANSQDFTLTYYSETQNLLIKYRAQDAVANDAKESSSANDDTRKRDLDNIRTALLLYSSRNIDPQSTQQYVFPTNEKYKTALVPDFLTSIPKDPKTAKDYDYKVSPTFDTFILKVVLDNPTPGTTGWLCNQEECQAY